MSVATPDELQAFYPEFAAVADPTVQLYLDVAFAEMNSTRWASSILKFAEMALAAHKMIMAGTLGGSGGGAASGQVTAVSVGDVSVSYAASSASAATTSGSESLKLSKYGLEFSRMAMNQGFGFYVPGAGP